MTEEKTSLLLFQTLEGIIEDLKEIERENYRNFLKGFVDEASPSYSLDGCEHSVSHVDLQRSPLPICTARRMEEAP